MDTSYFKDLLEREKDLLEKALGSIGRKNPDRKGDWEAVEKTDGIEAEEGDVALELSEYDDNRSELDKLEARLGDVNSALDKVEANEYGTCEVCEKPIEEDRLEADPTAKTCKAHMN